MKMCSVITSRSTRCSLALFVMIVVALPGCPPPADRVSDLLIQMKDSERRNRELERHMGAREARIAKLEKQVDNLLARDGARPLTFDIEHVRILDITSGTNLDGQPGDDAVAVYVRPVDRDGDALKRGGRIKVELYDLSQPGQPRSLGVTTIDDPVKLRGIWYGKLWTDYFKVIAKLPTGAGLLPGQEIDVKVWFTDFGTGREFNARKTIKINLVSPDERGGH